MTHVSALDQSVISGLQSHIAIFKYSDSELEALALGILEGIKLAGAQAPLLELAVVSNNIQRMITGELTD